MVERSLSDPYATQPIKNAQPQPNISRRNILRSGILLGCALTGLGTGTSVALLTHMRAAGLTASPPARGPLPTAFQLQLIHRFSEHQATVRSLAWSHDDQLLASGDDDTAMLIWRLDGTILTRVTHQAPVNAIAWSPLHMELATGAGPLLTFFQADNGLVLAQHQAHEGRITGLAWLGHPPAPLISVSLDKRALVWDTHHHIPVRVFQRHTAPIEAIAAASNGLLASASQGGVVRLWQDDTLQIHGFYQETKQALHTVAFAPQGYLVTGGDGGQLHLWSHPGTCEHSVASAGEQRCTDAPQRMQVTTTALRALAWSPEGRYLATGGDDGMLTIWQMTSSSPKKIMQQTHSAPITALAWSARQYLAVASGQSIYLWQWGAQSPH